jgi:hypothetical protein
MSIFYYSCLFSTSPLPLLSSFCLSFLRNQFLFALTNELESRTQPVASAADVNKDNETAAALKAVVEGIDRMEQQLAAKKDESPATPQHVVDRPSTLEALVGSQLEHVRDEDDPMDEDGDVARTSSAPATRGALFRRTTVASRLLA